MGLLGLFAAADGHAAPPRVVASIKPIHALAASVMAGIASPDLLVRGAASPHDYALRPSDAKALNAADVVFWIGPELENTLEQPLKALSTKAIVIPLAHARGVVTRGSQEAGANRIDGHVWLDIDNAIAMAAAMAGVLAEVDQSNAQRYAANAEAMKLKLQDLDAHLHGELAAVKARPFIVFHDAYRYFTDRYDLNSIASVTMSPERAPGARHLAQLKTLIEGGKAVCIFAEPQFQPKLMKTLEEGGHVRTGVLDPEGSTLEPGPDLYINLITAVGDSLVQCLATP